ncbi:MAG: cytosolic thiouridylase subunit Ctu1 [Ramalina farinacea]|uniref:Cytoplasmic tRNA 2-thiolation protein 1 n=1 Tax=Ramalina farinacea TaxID=258253 RepID=A0AA43TXV7_9LECA|nr:cytosolic thiouridylase subunit Ctu1 [Ramalina farinacea]
MPLTLCALCKNSKALIIRPKDHQKLCKQCFINIFEAEIHDTITSNKLFQQGERVAIGASGGKDSTVLASVLKTLNERHKYGLDLVLLSIDEGIKGYRDDSLETVKRNSVQYGLPLEIVGYGELYGWTMDQVVDQIGKKGNCTYCGVFRRQALDRGAARLNIKHVVTGHNADDLAETVMMNLLRGDLPRLARSTSIVTASSASEIKRSKPLKYAYEKEIVLYAHHQKLDYFTTECIYSPEAFRGSARTLIKNLERVRPSSILDVVKSGEDMAKLVPVESGGPGQRPGDDLIVIGAEADEAGGCGSADGRGSGGEMFIMEAQLLENEKAFAREVDITHSTRTFSRPQGPRKLPKKLPQQQMGKCQRCGYLSSQVICKACNLLEGLNKNRPKTSIRVGMEEAENGPTLTRRMESLATDVT